ncbi:MAG: hypothetical protein AAF747_05540, partial [Planctomycetota bacterium]
MARKAQSRSNPTPRNAHTANASSRRLRSIAAAAALVIAATGCSDPLARIDRQVAQLAEYRTRQIDGGARPPIPRDLRTPTRDETASSLVESPGTTNPAASELSYTPQQRILDEEGRFDTEATTERVTRRLQSYGAAAVGLGATDVQTVTLEDAFSLAQTSARDYRTAEESYLLAAIAVLVQRHLFSPRLFNDTSFGFTSVGDNGRFENAVSLVNSLRVTQQLPYGGNVEAEWIWQASEQLRSSID